MKIQAYTPEGIKEIEITTKNEILLADIDKATSLEEIKTSLKKWLA